MLCRVLFALLLASATYAKSIGDTCCPPPPSNDPVPGTWTLTFEDDFEGVALNPEHWTASNYSDQISRYDGHAALFVADRVSVSGGQLRIDTVLETTTFQGVTYNFTSGWIDSQHKVNQTKGRFEARMKMPNANATGGWPSWWLLPEGECWPVSGEVDIMEIWMGEGHEQHSTPGNPISIASTYHWGYSCYEDESSYPTNSRWFPDLNNKTAPLIDFSSDFHVFGVEINDTALRFYVDSQDSFVQFLPELCITQDNYHNHTPYMPFSPLYGIIAVAVSQGQGGNDWWKSSNATTLVDWVKWYEFVPSSPVSTLLAASPPLPPATPVPGNWVMTFEETFDGSALNSSRWTVANWSSVKSEYDGHDALFTAERVSVGGGHLRIDTVLESNTLDGILYNMTSGWIDTQQKVNQTKGRFEASIKMPNPNATGTWPAWWLLPEGECWPISGEIDIVEWWAIEGNFQHSRTNNPVVSSQTYHYGYSCGADVYSYTKDHADFPSRDWSPNWPIIDFSADFHTFGVEVNETSLRYYVDNYTSFTLALPPLCVTGAAYHNHSAYMPFKPLYGILNVAVNPNSNTSWWKVNHNTTTLFDWVRWYEFVPSTGEEEGA